MRFSSMKRNLIIASLVATLFAAAGVRAQVGTTSLRGTVTDKSGAVVANAKVSLINAGQALTREMNTSNTGEYEFLALPPGTYSLTVEITGFRKFENKNVQLLVNRTNGLNRYSAASLFEAERAIMVPMTRSAIRFGSLLSNRKAYG